MKLARKNNMKDKNGKKIKAGDIVKHVICCRKHDGIHEGSGQEFLVTKGERGLMPFADELQGDSYQNSENYEIIYCPHNP